MAYLDERQSIITFSAVGGQAFKGIRKTPATQDLDVPPRSHALLLRTGVTGMKTLKPIKPTGILSEKPAVKECHKLFIKIGH